MLHKKRWLILSLIPIIVWLYADNSNNVTNVVKIIKKIGIKKWEQQSYGLKNHATMLNKYQIEKPLYNIVIVSCGDSRFTETINLIKSIIMFSEKISIDIYLFADIIGEKIKKKFLYLKNIWIKKYQGLDIQLRIVNPFSQNQEFDYSKTEFAPCANLRLYIPELLPKSKSRAIYIDTDVLFLANPGSLFLNVFKKMEQNNKMIALTTENKNDDMSYYFKYSLLPSLYYGLNSGIIFMNLDYMRKYFWTDKVRLTFSFLSNSLVFSDQDIFNFLFFLQPNVFLELHCNYNFRPDHCYSRHYFTTSKEKGLIMHGSRSAFHNIDLKMRTLRMFKWFLSSLLNNPLLFLYSLKVIHINAEFDFFRMVYRSVEKASPNKSHIKEISKTLKSATACSDFKKFLLHSIKI